MATKSQEILLKGNTTSASAVPSSLKVREIAINALDRSLFTNDGNNIVKLYTGTTKWFDVNGNANNALKLGGVLASEYIGKEAFNTHTNNTTIHITSTERTAWNNKWDYDEEIIKGVKVNAAVLSDKATKLATSRTLWGKPFDGSANVDGDLKDVGNITASGKATIQGDIISGGEVAAIVGEGTPVGVTDYSALTGKPSINGVTLVSGNNTLASLGIQAAGNYITESLVDTKLDNYTTKTFVANNYVGKAAFNNHTADTDIHITSSDRMAWNSKWDFDADTIKAVKVNAAGSADKLTSNAGTSAIPIYFDGGTPVQCTPSSLFSTFTNGYDASAGGWRLLMITIAGHTRSVVVGYSETAGSVAWSGITGKPTTFTPSAHTHTASEVSGLPTSLKNPNALTFGSKTYDGSAAATITASDLGALTAHQTIYTLTLQVNGTSKGTYNPTSTAKTINITVPTKTSDLTNNSGFITSAAIPTALKNPFAVEIKANGVSLGTYDGSKTATFNLNANNVGAASKVHSHYSIVTEGDNRSVATKPNDYINRFVFKGLKNNSTIGSPSSDIYSYLIGLRGWSDNSGGDAHELAFNNSGIFRRQGSTTEWGSWYQLIDTGNFTKSLIEGVLTGDITSHTHTFASLTSKPTTIAGYGITDALTTSNYNSYAPTLTGTGASGTWGISISGNAATATNADKLDGVHYQNILERLHSGVSSSGTATGWFRIAETLTTDAGGITFLLAIQRSYNSISNESYLFSISISYYGGISITQLSGYANTRLITKIRVDRSNSQIAYVDLYIASSSTFNNYYWYTVGCAKSYTAWTANPTLVGTAYEFITVNGCKSDRGFTGDLVGNSSSATKLQDNTAFTAWGQTFFQSGKPKNVSGDLSLGASKLYWNGDIDGSFISSFDRSQLTYDMRDGHSFRSGGEEILRIKKNTTYKLQVYGKTNIAGDLIVEGEVSALVS